MTDWWVSTKSPRNIFRLSYHNPACDAFLRDNVGIDAAILAEHMGLGVDQVKAYQRRLGLRKCVPPGRRQEVFA